MANSRQRRKRALVRAAISQYERGERETAALVAAQVRRNLRGGLKRDPDAGFISSVTMVQAGPSRPRGKRSDTLYHAVDATRIAKTATQLDAIKELRRTATDRENRRK